MDSDSEVICLCILVQFNSYSRCTRYKDMTGSAKCRKWGDLGWLGVTDLQYHNSIECIRLPIQLGLAILVDLRLVTDGQTDKHCMVKTVQFVY